MCLRNITAFVVLIVALFVSPVVFAAGRVVSLEWEKDLDAVSYEIEIGARGTDRVMLSIRDLRESEWSGRLKPGRYWMKVRGVDDREIAGSWSEPVQFEVKLAEVELVAPKADENFETKDEADKPASMKSVDFKWLSVDGATAYNFVLTDDHKKTVHSARTSETKLTLPVKPAMKYAWTVQAVDEEGNLGKTTGDAKSFTVLGGAPEKSYFEKPETPFVRALELKLPQSAEFARVVVRRYDEQQGAWVTVLEGKSRKPTLNFRQNWPGGRYQVTARSEAKYRAPASVSEVDFDVAEGDRGVEAENRATIRTAIEPTENWTVSTSYVFSSVAYDAQLTEDNSQSRFSALSSGLSVGAGKFKSNSPWGFQGALDIMGLKIENQTHFNLGLEGGGAYKFAPNYRSDLRVKAGLALKTFAQVEEVSTSKVGTLVTLGPSLAGEYWYSLTPKLALQGSLGVRMNAVGSSASGAGLDPSFSYQAGLLAGWKFNPKTAAMIGYSFSQENFGFKGRNEALDVEGENSIGITGHYLKLLFEYGL